MADQQKACRSSFEREISSPPYEKATTRWPDAGEHAWPGQYRDYEVELAWCMFQVAWNTRAQAEGGEAVTLEKLKSAISHERWCANAGSGASKNELANARIATNSALESIYAKPPRAQGGGETFQSGVASWMAQCFLPSLYSNMTERGDRLLEEVLELLQAHGYDKSRVATLVDYVYGRPVGEPSQEVGGVMVTLAGFCWIAGLDMHEAGATELARITQPDVMAKIRAKQEAKNALHFDTPVPGHAEVANG